MISTSARGRPFCGAALPDEIHLPNDVFSSARDASSAKGTSTILDASVSTLTFPPRASQSWSAEASHEGRQRGSYTSPSSASPLARSGSPGGTCVRMRFCAFSNRRSKLVVTICGLRSALRERRRTIECLSIGAVADFSFRIVLTR